MSYQFAHVSTYSRKASAGSSAGWSAQDIADENERKPSACHHVKEPMPPVLLYGVMPSQAVAAAHAWAEQAKDVRGSKLRADALCVVAGVISIGADDFEKWDAYKLSAIEYLQQQHGDRLQSVVEHVDEACPHIHFYIVPRGGETMDAIHVGLAARNAAKYAKQTTSDQNAEYKKAMEGFQTKFYDNVSSRFGLLRDGPKRERVSRPVWRAQQAAAKLTAQMMEQANADARQMLVDAMSDAHDQGATYIARVKLSAEKFIADKKSEGIALTKKMVDAAQAEARTIKTKAAQTGKAEATAKWSGVAGVVAVVREAVSSDKADTLGALEAKHETERRRDAVLINIHQQAALKATQRAEVATRSEKLKNDEIATLKTKLQALTPTATHCHHAPGNTPAPGL